MSLLIFHSQSNRCPLLRSAPDAARPFHFVAAVFILMTLSGMTALAATTNEELPTQIQQPATSRKFAGKISIDVGNIDRKRILRAANSALTLKPLSIVQHRAELSAGGPNDFYSNGDYFWPDPKKADGLPYINRDGLSNPGNFSEHRLAMRQLRDAVAALAAAYRITGEDRYVRKAVELLHVFFVDPATRMNPNLKYAQAVPGRATGRSWGIIDGLHLAEIPVAISAMQSSPVFPRDDLAALKKWFSELADWMMTSENGKLEGAARNNHSVAYFVQIAAFSRFTGGEQKLAESRRQFKEVFVPKQMAVDGSFPLELKRRSRTAIPSSNSITWRRSVSCSPRPRRIYGNFNSLMDAACVAPWNICILFWRTNPSGHFHRTFKPGKAGPRASRACCSLVWRSTNPNTSAFGKPCPPIRKTKKSAATSQLPNPFSGSKQNREIVELNRCS